METTLAILTVLGIFIGIPAVIGFAVAGVYIMSDRRAKRAERAKALAGATAKEPVKETAKEPTMI